MPANPTLNNNDTDIYIANFLGTCRLTVRKLNNFERSAQVGCITFPSAILPTTAAEKTDKPQTSEEEMDWEVTEERPTSQQPARLGCLFCWIISRPPSAAGLLCNQPGRSRSETLPAVRVWRSATSPGAFGLRDHCHASGSIYHLLS